MGGATISIGAFLLVALLRLQRKLYVVCLFTSYVLTSQWIAFSNIANSYFFIREIPLELIGKLRGLLILYGLYIVVYSQDMVSVAQFGDINPLNQTFSFLLNFPGIAVHVFYIALCRYYLPGLLENVQLLYMIILESSIVKDYFQRGWAWEDLFTNPEEYAAYALGCLRQVYLTLFVFNLSITGGTLLHLMFQVGGVCTMLVSVACIHSISVTMRRRLRILLLLSGACFLGASIGPFASHWYQIDQRVIFIFWCLAVEVTFTFLLVSMMTTGMLYRLSFIFSVPVWLVILWHFIPDQRLEMIVVLAILSCYEIYLIGYSQETLHRAQRIDVDCIDRTIHLIYDFPAISLHVLLLVRQRIMVRA